MPDRFERINPYKEHITHLSLSRLYEADDEIVEWIRSAPKILDATDDDEADDIAQFMTEYQASKKLVGLMGYLRVVRSGSEGSDDAGTSTEAVRILVFVGYWAPGIPKTSRTKPLGPREADLIEQIERLSPLADHKTSVRIEFEYEGTRGDELWFPLPSTLSGGRSMNELFEVQGVRGRKLAEDNATMYRFQLDHSADGDTDLGIRFANDAVTPLHPREAISLTREWTQELVPPSARTR